MLRLLLFLFLISASLSWAQPTVPNDLLGLDPARINALLPSQHMTLVTSSYTVTDPTTDASLASITLTTGETGYILGYRAGGTAQGFVDLYTSATRAYRSAFFGDYSDTGWVWCPEWSSLSATAGTTLSVRATAAMSGTYSATILVGKVR